jgi:hypothetical protein
MKKALVPAVALLLSLGIARPASAITTITPGTDGIERISGGVFELGLDNLLLVRYASTGSDPNTVSTLEASYLGGLTPRFFLADNFSLAANLQLFYGARSETAGGVETSSHDLGFLGLVMANYYVRLGWGMFFAPGIGGGGFYGTRSTPSLTPGTTEEAALYGGAIKVDLGFVFYAGSHFNLKGGPDILVRFGNVKPEGVDGESLLSIEAGFHIGLAYSI